MTCVCEKIRTVTALTVVGSNVNMTISNSNNLSSVDVFKLVLCVDPNSVVTAGPLPFTATINGSTAQVYNQYHLPLYTNRIKKRKPYTVAYVNNGTDAWLEFLDTPCCPNFATP